MPESPPLAMEAVLELVLIGVVPSDHIRAALKAQEGMLDKLWAFETRLGDDFTLWMSAPRTDDPDLHEGTPVFIYVSRGDHPCDLHREGYYPIQAEFVRLADLKWVRDREGILKDKVLPQVVGDNGTEKYWVVRNLRRLDRPKKHTDFRLKDKSAPAPAIVRRPMLAWAI
jgi:hypothetical protein